MNTKDETLLTRSEYMKPWVHKWQHIVEAQHACSEATMFIGCRDWEASVPCAEQAIKCLTAYIEAVKANP